MADINERIRSSSIRERIMTAAQAADMISSDMTIGCSGFTPSGYPKAVPQAIAERKELHGQRGLTVLTGASVGREIDEILTGANILKRRYPYQSNDLLRNSINSGEIYYSDIHLSHFPQQIRYKHFGDLDIAIIEAAAITAAGNIIPTTSVGASPTFVSEADKVIVELNLNKPAELEGIHDIYQPEDPPRRKAIPLNKASDKIGLPYISVAPEKIVAVVKTEFDYHLDLPVFQNETSAKIASHIIEFLEREVGEERLPENLLPLQSGVGAVANAVLSGLGQSSFKNLEFYSEVIQDAVLDLLDQEVISIASGTSITLSNQGYSKFVKNLERYKQKIILRPQEISNNPEVIRRLGVISINTALEFDIYGNVNSTSIAGSQMLNGIGGSGDFARNSYLSFFVSPSTAKEGSISSIVPMVTHVDHPEHDVDILVTENGLADLRGLAPRERAEVIIANCAAPKYKDILMDYFLQARKQGGQTPHILAEAFTYLDSYKNERKGDDIDG